LGQDAHAETTAMVGLTSTRLCAAAAVCWQKRTWGVSFERHAY
jgi:hypothetical protein